MKKGHFKINLVVICLLMLTLFVACNNNSTPPTNMYTKKRGHMMTINIGRKQHVNTQKRRLI